MAHPQPDLIVSRAKRMNPRKFDDLAKIEVGPSDCSKIYTIYSEAVTSRSVFFRKALSGSWKETGERLVRMPNDDIEIFELYLHLVYHNKFACTPDPPSGTETGEEERLSLARLYVLCEKLRDIHGKNTVIKALLSSVYKLRYDGQWRFPSTAWTHIIYEGTVEGSPARQFILDVFAYNVKIEWLNLANYPISGYPAEFLQMLALRLMEKRQLPESQHPARTDGGLEYQEEGNPDKIS